MELNNINKERIPDFCYHDRLPRSYLRKTHSGNNIFQVESVLISHRLNTVCKSAKCPNRGECYSKGTATFMLMGDSCTRKCSFCGVAKGVPKPLDEDEPKRTADAALSLNLKHVVITSVTRDDLPDGGAGHFAATIECIKAALPESTIEVLVPDFNGKIEAIERVLSSKPDVFNHNVETVPELYSIARPEADFYRSVEVLKIAGNNGCGIVAKTGIMVGIGETEKQLKDCFGILAESGCKILTVGQYLRPGKDNMAVARYYEDYEFEEVASLARNEGIPVVVAGPFVRSSYRAGESLAESGFE